MTGIACPSCGGAISVAGAADACPACGAAYRATANCITWTPRAYDYAAARRSAVWRSAFNPLANPYSPIVRAVHRVVDAHYERTLIDASLALRFADYYLPGVVRPGARVLDHGCGRGRLVGLLQQLGATVCAQDLARASWWDRLPNATFQAVSPEFPRLPWTDAQFDAVLDFGVVEYFSADALEALAGEVRRVMKGGGVWVVWTANPGGRGSRALQSPYVHAPAAVEAAARRAGLALVSRRYEGLAARRWPVLRGALRTIRLGAEFDSCAYGEPAGVADAEKSKYTLVFRTP